MEQQGLTQDMLDVKILILYVAANASHSLSLQELYELCYQDDRLSYFDLSIAVPQMVATGHLEKLDGDRYLITDYGKEASELTNDAIPFTIKRRAKIAVERFNRQIQRDNMIRTQTLARDNGDYSVVLGLDDEKGNLMTLELMAASAQQAGAMENAFRTNAERIYQMVMNSLMEQKDHAEL